MYLGERNIKTKDPIEASHGDLVVVSKGSATPRVTLGARALTVSLSCVKTKYFFLHHGGCVENEVGTRRAWENAGSWYGRLRLFQRPDSGNKKRSVQPEAPKYET